jgi:hypothetical protein
MENRRGNNGRAGFMVTMMSRHPIGPKAMTVGERQRRYIAKQAAALAPTGLIIKVDHLRLYPDKMAPWLHRQLGHGATIALCDALGRAIEAAAEESA